MSELDEQIESAVAMFFIYNRISLLKSLAPLLSQKDVLLKTEDSSFHPEIELQFEALIRREVAEFIASNLDFDPEQVFLIVETLDVPEFIKGFIPVSEEKNVPT